MEDSITELTAYSAIILIYEKPSLDAAETAILRYLKQGKTQTYISDALGFNIDYIIAELAYKRIINLDGTFKYKNERIMASLRKKEYKRSYIFFDNRKGMFFDCLIYPWEIRLSEKLLLTNPLGKDFIPEDVLKAIRIINKFTVYYEPDKEPALQRRLSEIMLKK